MSWLGDERCPSCSGSPDRLLLQATDRRYPTALREAVLRSDSETVRRLVQETAQALRELP